jgi:hypothetical protein
VYRAPFSAFTGCRWSRAVDRSCHKAVTAWQRPWQWMLAPRAAYTTITTQCISLLL